MFPSDSSMEIILLCSEGWWWELLKEFQSVPCMKSDKLALNDVALFSICWGWTQQVSVISWLAVSISHY